MGMVSESFKRCRERAGLSLREAAERLEVPVGVVAKFEEGKAEPDALLLRRMAQAYRCTSDELLGIVNG